MGGVADPRESMDLKIKTLAGVRQQTFYIIRARFVTIVRRKLTETYFLFLQTDQYGATYDHHHQPA